MEVKFGEGKTEYGTGISITLDSNEVANAITKYIESKGYTINGARTVKVRAQNNQGEAEIYVIADYDMVQNLNLHNSGSINQVSGQLPVVLAGLGVARWVVMDKNQGNSVMGNGAFNNLAGRDSAAIYCPFKEVGYFNNLTLAAQVNNFKYLFLEVSH